MLPWAEARKCFVLDGSTGTEVAAWVQGSSALLEVPSGVGLQAAHPET